MDKKLIDFKQKIAEYFPQMNITSIKSGFDHGLHNDLILVNDELVVRFAKDDAAKKLLENEYRCIRLLKDKTNVPVPDMSCVDYGVVCYPYIHGQPLFRHRLFQLDAAEQQSIMEQIADYMKQIHTIPLAEVRRAGIAVSLRSTDDPSEHYQNIMNGYERIKRELYPHMRPYTRSCVDAAYKGLENGSEWFDYTPCLIHGDLALEHFILDEDYKNITGILDFGVAGTGNPAHDMGVLLDGLGERFTSLMCPVYPDLDIVLSRARVGLCSAGWHLRGNDTGDIFWHLTHLMTAKDIHY